MTNTFTAKSSDNDVHFKNPRPEVIRIIKEYLQAKSDGKIPDKQIEKGFQEQIAKLKVEFRGLKSDKLIDEVILKQLKQNKEELQKELDSLEFLMNRMKFKTEKALDNT